ncbi:hypothetical protein IFM53868_06361, partial [Aspergillus udagawae]
GIADLFVTPAGVPIWATAPKLLPRPLPRSGEDAGSVVNTTKGIAGPFVTPAGVAIWATAPKLTPAPPPAPALASKTSSSRVPPRPMVLNNCALVSITGITPLSPPAAFASESQERRHFAEKPCRTATRRWPATVVNNYTFNSDGHAITISAHPTSAGAGTPPVKKQKRRKRPNKAKKKEEGEKKEEEKAEWFHV